MNEYYDLNIDEVENALTCLYNLMKMKKFEEELGEDHKEYFDNMYRYVLGIRDFDAESYNGVEESPIGYEYLDLIFKDDYKLERIAIDKDREMYEELYYNFRVEEEDRFYTEEDFDNFGLSYMLLTLKSEAIEEALKIASNDKSILDKILSMANDIRIDAGDVRDYATVNLSENQVEILLSWHSGYYIEDSSDDLFRLEMYCRKVAGIL